MGDKSAWHARQQIYSIARAWVTEKQMPAFVGRDFDMIIFVL